MKINRVKATNKNKIGPIGPNFHYLLKLIGKMLKIMAGILISVVILMFIAEKVFTDEVHMIDDALSDKMFRSLVTNRQYHNAIYLIGCPAARRCLRRILFQRFPDRRSHSRLFRRTAALIDAFTGICDLPGSAVLGR